MGPALGVQHSGLWLLLSTPGNRGGASLSVLCGPGATAPREQPVLLRRLRDTLELGTLTLGGGQMLP